MASILDLLQPSANSTAVGATNAALDTAAARPFSVVVSVAPDTQAWIDSALRMSAVSAVILAVLAGLILRRMK